MGINGLDKLQQKLEQLKEDIDDAANEAVEDGLDDVERAAKRNIVEEDAIQRAEMYRGFVQESVVESPKLTRHTLSNTVPHAKLQEFGTGQQFGTSLWAGVFQSPARRYKAPDFSPVLVGAISEWIIEKPSFRPDGPPQEAAVPIAASIAGMGRGPSGSPPQPFMRPAWFMVKPKLQKRVNAAVRNEIRRF